MKCDMREKHAAFICRVTELVQVAVVNVTGRIPLKRFYISDVFTSATLPPHHLLEPFTHPEDGDSIFLHNIRTFNNYMVLKPKRLPSSATAKHENLNTDFENLQEPTTAWCLVPNHSDRLYLCHKIYLVH